MAGFGDQQGANRTDSTPRGGQEQRGSYTPFQLFFIARLTRLVRLQREYRQLLDDGDWRLRLLRKAVYSTYCDCLALGIGDHAGGLIHVLPPSRDDG